MAAIRFFGWVDGLSIVSGTGVWQNNQKLIRKIPTNRLWNF